MKFIFIIKIFLSIGILIFVQGCADRNEPQSKGGKMQITDHLYLEVASEIPQLIIEGPINDSELRIFDVVEGGSESTVSINDTLEVNYVGVGSITGFEFDSSFARGESAAFPLSRVIEGWQVGLIGMREGGRRILIIPSDLAYGSNPPPGSGIEPNESLIFLVDLITIL